MLGWTRTNPGTSLKSGVLPTTSNIPNHKELLSSGGQLTNMDAKETQLLKDTIVALERQIIRMRSAYALQQKEIVYWKSFVYSEYPEDHVESFEREVQVIRDAHNRLAYSPQVDADSTQREEH